MTADLSEIRDALAKATPGEWVGATPPDDSTDTVGEYLVNTCANPDAHATYLHAVWATDETERQGRVIIVAYTGDGPTSYQNRELIANAPAWLAELCDRAERAEAAVERVRALAEGWRDRGDHQATFAQSVPEDMRDALLEAAADWRDKSHILLRALDGAQ